MSLFQNTARVSSVEVAHTTTLGTIVWKIRLESGEVYLTEPGAEIKGSATAYIGKTVVIRLRHNRITYIGRP